MRTRKHQSPVEAGWMEKHKCENGTQLTPDAQATSTKGNEAANGIHQPDLVENSVSVDQKKINGKKQKRRRKSPKNKAVVPKVDSALLGLMEDMVWFDKYLYDNAECAHHIKIAEERVKELDICPTLKGALGKVQKTVDRVKKKGSSESCTHGNTMACHHVDNGVWLNKFSFDDAESQFVTQFASPLAPRALNLNLVSSDSGVMRSTQRTPDEGYSSATPTPAAPDMLTIHGTISEPTVNGKPHWATVQDLLSQVWLDKSVYDQAERCFYEHVADEQTSLQPEPHFSWNMNSGKKGKRDKVNRKSAGKQQSSRKRELPSIPEETINSVYYPVYFLHSDSEPVWLDKTDYDRAEAYFYAAQVQEVPCTVKFCKPNKAKQPRPVKAKHQDKK